MREIFQREAFNRNDFEHEVAQFVDDSNSIIIISDRTQIMMYLNKYFQLLKIFYNLNKLKINDDKTNLMLINNPRHEAEVKDTKITTNTDIIKPKEKFTILGWVINRKFDYTDHLNYISSRLHHRIHRANEVKAYMSEQTRKIFADAYLFSLINYGAPLMFNTSTQINLKMHKQHMICSRFVKGRYGFKQSCIDICKSAGKKVSSEEYTDACT